MTAGDPSEREGLPPGYDEANPYESADVEDYPEWWRENIEEHREFGLRPYRPPRFTDGSIVPEVVDAIENEEGVDVQICSVNPHEDDDWEVRVDGETVMTVEHWRSDDGYSVYDVTADEFRSGVEDSLDSP
jgi:hypothetical protein